MVRKIIWLPEAIRTYLGIIDYLQSEWTEQEIAKFAELVRRKLATLEMQPRIGRRAGKKRNVFRTVVHKKVTLVYRYKPVKKEIELVTFWNNLQDPGRLKF